MNIIGKILASRYEILEKIGEGGMAIVYKARCNLLNRYVAVKVLKPEYAKDDTFVKRFRAEAQSAAALTHPNIVSVYDVGAEDGINYIVMELLESKTLKDYIEENGALSNLLVLKISSQIASALEAAHRAHIIHRDIKPQNIILNKNMVAKVTDFGIAKITNVPSATITSFGSTMGSVHYFSPEHAKGGYTDEKSDIYSLGVVMYEMATGKLPFDADSPVSVALKHIQEEPKPPIAVNPKISEALNDIILKAMSKSTVTRYQNATELLDDITNVMNSPSSSPVSKKPASVEASATQILPVINEEDINKVPNLRFREPRRMAVSQSKNKIVENEEKLDSVSKDDSKKDDGEGLGKKKKRKKVAIIYIVIAAVIFIILCTIFGIRMYKKISASNVQNEEVEIPNLIGRNIEEVIEEYKKQGIEVIQDKVEFSSEQEEGNIISQSPEKGTMTKNKKVYVVVSKGEKLVEVPDVTGKDVKVATYELQDTLGFSVEIEEVVNEKVAAGIIISQDPKSETTAPYGSTIKLKVSKGDGKAQILVKNVVGKTEEEAKSELSGLTVNVKYSEDKTKPNGVVLSQSYPENQQLKEGELIEITVNRVQKTKTVTLDMVELTADVTTDNITVKVTASVDGGAVNTIYEKTMATSATTPPTFTINGYESATINVYVNGVLKKEQKINF